MLEDILEREVGLQFSTVARTAIGSGIVKNNVHNFCCDTTSDQFEICVIVNCY